VKGTKRKVPHYDIFSIRL